MPLEQDMNYPRETFPRWSVTSGFVPFGLLCLIVGASTPLGLLAAGAISHCGKTQHSCETP